jgi:nucleoside triphosphate pyrophosphatase
VTPPLVLASGSPRRHGLLQEVGIDHEVAPSGEEENLASGETVDAHICRLAVAKARAVAARYPDRWVLGADTVVVLEGRILGKPSGTSDARRMLARMSGRTHEVCGAIALVYGGRQWLGSDTSRVTFRHLREDEIAAYVAGGEPLDKAGAYGIQEEGRRLVVGWEGSFTNIVGLSVPLLRRLLVEAGAPYAIKPRHRSR